ncbi:MAG: helix-turn-helix domain-containing protein [Burkholderiales bacterium]|nr:helix-turn-helix domain-containing protein [Burkholderiales bacterium]
MSKNSASLQTLPAEAVASLAKLGENLALARVRRRESQREWARRMGISPPTLIRMERGDPTVSMGIYATALWMMGRINALPELAEPAKDMGALEAEVRAAARTRAVRSQSSIEGRLTRKAKAS